MKLKILDKDNATLNVFHRNKEHKTIDNVPTANLIDWYPLSNQYRLRQHWENYCDCVPVLPDEHLSRESQKLTVMMRRELVAVREVVKSLTIHPA